MLIKGKKADAYVDRYMSSEYRTLTDCYKNPSPAKRLAFTRCCEKMLKMCGYNDTILGYNSMVFTMAWRYYDFERCADMLHVETAHNSYDMII